MNVLITGGCGFIGSNFVRQCLQGDVVGKMGKLVNLDLLTYAGNPDNLSDLADDARYEFVRADICNFEKVGALLREHQIDAVIHFAAESHVDRSIDSPEPFFQTNVIGTLRLLEASRQYWNNLSAKKKKQFRFLHVSTDEVYGTLGPDDPAFSETTPFAPNSPYAASKAGSDHAVRAYFHTYGMPVLTTNCSNNYGPYQFPEKLIPLMILNALEEKPLPIYGDGGNIRDWLFVEDHCSAVGLVLQKGKLGETYNIGGCCEKTNLEVVSTICSVLDKTLPKRNGFSYQDLKSFVKDRPGHDRRYAMDCEKISSELGWRPSETFESGIRKTIQWYLDHRQWCEKNQHYQRQRLGLETA